MQNSQVQASEKVTVIRPQTTSSFIDLKELWAYRELVWVMVGRDIKVRYKQTVMGVAWAIIQPLTMLLIFSVVFGRLAKIPSDGFPYPIFVFSGMLAWNLFSSSVNAAGMSLVGSSNLVSKVYFPRIIIPIASIGTAFVDFLISCVLLICMMLIYGVPLSANVVYLPLLLCGLLMVSVGIGSWLASVTVMYRDFRFLIAFMLQIWMYITPVIYPISLVPDNWKWLLYLNPMFAWISAIRSSFLGQPIDVLGTVISLAISIAILIFGLRYFERTQRRFADTI